MQENAANNRIILRITLKGELVMRKMLITDISPGMVLAKNVYSSDGKVLLAKGVVLKNNYINKLLLLNIPAVFVTDPNLPQLDIPELISEETRVQAISNVRDVFNQIPIKNPQSLRKVCDSVNQIMDELLRNPKILYNLSDIRSYDNYTFSHCVNVAVLSILTGISLNLNQLQLKELGVGAIMHDIGKIALNLDILNKPSKLNLDEFEHIKSHSLCGFDLLRRLEGISSLSAHVAFQHHERVDGTGYPRGLRGDDIHIYAKIVAVVDVYDALVADRVYRHAYSSQEAAEMITYGANQQFDQQVIDAFLKNIAIFPIGSLVKLNTGDLAVVVDNNKDFQTRPIVKLLSFSKSLFVDPSQELDLCKHTNVVIQKIIKPQDPEYMLFYDCQHSDSFTS